MSASTGPSSSTSTTPNGERTCATTIVPAAPLLDHWVNSGVYVLGEEALALLPEKGDHEQSTFPQLAGERRLHAHRHEGVWLTVNTPKDLRLAAEFLEAHPEWRPQGQLA